MSSYADYIEWIRKLQAIARPVDHEDYKGSTDPETGNYPSIYLGEADYSGDKVVWTRGRKCDMCSIKSLCLHTDSSSDEYGPVILCLPCIKRIMGDSE